MQTRPTDPSGSVSSGSWFDFLGRRVVLLLGVGLASGLLIFLVELGFAYILQTFLAALGVATVDQLRVPRFLTAGSILSASILLMGAGVLRAGVNGIQKYAQHAVVHEFLFVQRTRIVNWALCSRESSSALVSTLLDARCNGAALAIQGFLQAILFGGTSLLLGLYLLHLSPVLTAALGVALAGMNLPLRSLNRRCESLGKETGTESQAMMKRLMVGIRNLLFLKIYGAGEKEAQVSIESLRRIRTGDTRFVFLNMMAQLYPNLIGPIVMAAVAVVGKLYLALDGSVLLAYFYLIFRLFQGVSSATTSLSQFRFHAPHAVELKSWWVRSATPIMPASTVTGRSILQSPIGFQVKELAYRYHGGAGPVFVGLNFRIPPGTAWVCMGESGVGKSTLLSLLLGQLDPTQGEVTVELDGRTAALQASRRELLDNVGYVGPEPFLFDGTIRENLLYALEAPLPDDDLILRVLDQAECGFVRELPRGLDHPLSEQGLGLSAGQKQRLGLARALLREPKVLVLDEATANLDFETEAKLVNTLGRLKGKMTLLIVTHRAALRGIGDSLLELKSSGS